MLSPQWLDELRARVTLSSVIMRTTKLIRAGNEWKACCPFHDEKTPSFTVNDSKGFYHCFGCSAHGDVIRWMTDQRGLSFMDAVKELAAEAGMELPRADPKEAARAERRASLHDVMAAAQEFFRNGLEGQSGTAARAYLTKRRISADLATKFGFGLALDERQGITRQLSQFDRAMLIEAGLLIDVEGKEPYARFRGRLMLPIHDARERIIGFGGRILEGGASDAPKYLNSPDTPLFDKGRTLYNLHRAGPISRKSGRLIAVEGYMDVIALAGAGIEDAVAPLGTALTEAQIELMWRVVDCPILCFDGDAAGQRALMRAAAKALPLLRPGKSLSFVKLPQGLDPDDLIAQQGASAMEALLSDQTSLLDTLWEHELNAQPVSTPELKANLKTRLLDLAGMIQQSDIRSLYRREFSDRYSAFAFPKRADRFGKKADSVVVPFRKKSAAPSAASFDVYWKARERHLYRRLGAAVAVGVMRRPSAAAPYLHELFQLKSEDLDDRLMLVAEHMEETGTRDPAVLTTALLTAGHHLPTPEEWDSLHFPFVRDDASDDRAIESLQMALRLYCRLPSMRAALEETNRDIMRDGGLSDGVWAEQQRLLKIVLQLKDELYELMAA